MFVFNTYITYYMPLLLLVGNHDLPGMASKASSVDIFKALDVPNVIVGNEPTGRVVDTRSGPVCLAWMPYPMRNRLLTHDQYKGNSVEDLDQALLMAVDTLVQDLEHHFGGCVLEIEREPRDGVVREVRGMGILRGVELVADTTTMAPFPALIALSDASRPLSPLHPLPGDLGEAFIKISTMV